MSLNKHIPSQSEILAMLRQARHYRLQAEAETQRQLAILDIIECAYGPDIPGLPDSEIVTD